MRARRFLKFLAVFGLAGALLISIFSARRFRPDPGEDGVFISRAQQKAASGLTVSASALGPEESRRSFGENLARDNIQPLWLSIQNDTDEPLYYLPVATDPAYYSPYEVSYRFHGAFSPKENVARDAYFLNRQMPSLLPPHARTSGFVYSVLDAGVKYVRVLVAGAGRADTFDFVLHVPGADFLGERIGAENLYSADRVEDVGLDALRTKLKDYPCCTTDASGKRFGDPLNLVVVESKRDPIAAFVSRGWHLSQTLDMRSVLETAWAFVFQDPYLTSPVSPLYLFGRREDFALQKARSTINERVHLRLWLTPEKIDSRRIWIGQVSRDIGVRLTDDTWNLTTHKIGPDVDFDRSYLLQDLLMSGFVSRFGFVEGVGEAAIAAPRTNLTGDPYFTDGLRLIVFLSDQEKALTDVGRLPWASSYRPRQH